MNELSPSTASDTAAADASASKIEELRRELNATRSILQLCLFAGIFTSAGVASFVGYQLRQLMKETEARTVALEQVRLEEVKMDALVDQLRQFGRTYPDYVPILNRVGLQAATSAAPASVLAPAPK